ncbi:MAG: hypothetical protein Q9162_003089 [Coniocarpon cinnabarinum]
MAGQDVIAGLLSLRSVRQRAWLLAPALRANTLSHFHVSLSHLESGVLPAVVDSIRDYVGTRPLSSIPPHGRWQHFSAGSIPRLDNLVARWQADRVSPELIVKRVIDLTVVSVLLDAGAGDEWKYVEDGREYNRSEGLAVASFHMFASGLFSSDDNDPFRVDAQGLESLTTARLAMGLQITSTNLMAGLHGRADLLRDLVTVLGSSEYFGNEARPGGMVTYLGLGEESLATHNSKAIDIKDLWDVLTLGLGAIWPCRTTVSDTNIGDAWHYPPISQMQVTGENRYTGTEAEDILPFHKLTQWLCYSILIPLKRLAGVTVAGEELLTGLPEYRNGGLFVDCGVLTLKQEDAERGLTRAKSQNRFADADVPLFEPKDEVIVEWRALTIVLLDMLLPLVNERLGEEMALAQMLEAGSWAAGRRVAAQKRPRTKGPPIGILSDGTVF